MRWNSSPSELSYEQLQPIELYYKFEKNCHLECQTTVFTCICSGCLQTLLLNASAWVWEWVECILFPLIYEENKCLHREKQSVWNFFITSQFHWLSLLCSLTVQCQTMALQTAASINKSDWRVPQGRLNSDSSTWKVICVQ